MNYEDVLNKIHSFHRFGSRLGLERMFGLLEKLGNPHKRLNIIHVAGTNGKGSTSRFIYSILLEQGYNVGLYTSPYLERFTERIESNGNEISLEDLVFCSEKVFKAVELIIEEGMDSPTEFEVVTAIAFLYYYQKQVDYLILEVGLGGKGDATNVVAHPIASVITTIAFDHMEYLGNTLSEIASEKAGIIKSKSPVITSVKDSAALDVIKTISLKKNSPLLCVSFEGIQNIESSLEGYVFDYITEKMTFKSLKIAMLGKHQIENAITALNVIYILRNSGIRIDEEAVYKGLRRAKQKGRFEIISKNPMVIIDGAHNLQGIEAFKDTVQQLFPDKKIMIGMGILKDKNVKEMIDILSSLADAVIVTEPDNSRKLEAKALKELMSKHNTLCYEIADPIEAVSYALSIDSQYDVILFTGSLYLIGKVRAFMNSKG